MHLLCLLQRCIRLTVYKVFQLYLKYFGARLLYLVYLLHLLHLHGQNSSRGKLVLLVTRPFVTPIWICIFWIFYFGKNTFKDSLSALLSVSHNRETWSIEGIEKLWRCQKGESFSIIIISEWQVNKDFYYIIRWFNSEIYYFFVWWNCVEIFKSAQFWQFLVLLY